VLFAKKPNIETAERAVAWNPAEVKSSLDKLLEYVEMEATKSINWYWQRKRTKALLSRFIQWASLVLAAVAALLPVSAQLFVNYTHRPGSILLSPLWASTFVGLAAALLGLDKAFGFSTGWTRYVLAATEVRKRLEEFRLDWIALSAAAGADPTPEQIAAFIQRAKEFRVGVEGVVIQETKEWATEFQNSMAQLEKDVKAQLETLKAQVEKSQAATQPGWIELTVANADKLQGATFKVIVENGDGAVIAQDQVNNSKKWIRLNVRPDTYRVTVSGVGPSGNAVSMQTAVTVKPGEGAKPPEITLA
jgi:conflict system pore-forming effector with SLATT domain